MEDVRKMDMAAEPDEFVELTDDEAAQVSGGCSDTYGRVETEAKFQSPWGAESGAEMPGGLGDDQTQKQQEK